MIANMHTVTIDKELLCNLSGDFVYLFRLTANGVTITFTNYGCTILTCETADKNGRMANITAGFNTVAAYKNNTHYFGCIVGRYANRIGNGRFELNGTTYNLACNDGNNHLHGGVDGFQKKVWRVKYMVQLESEAGVAFEYVSRDGEEGYPGNVITLVTYKMDTVGRLTITYSAVTDKATPISLTNHAYFNLSGFEEPVIDSHLLQVNAAYYTEKNELNLPTGRVLPVAGTGLDFRKAKPLGQDISSFTADMGYDHNFVLKEVNSPAMVKAARLEEPVSGRSLTIYTSAPGIQVYTANYWDGAITGPQGVPYVKHGAVALETQAFPDSPNQPLFPSTILVPGEEYKASTEYAFNEPVINEIGPD